MRPGSHGFFPAPVCLPPPPRRRAATGRERASERTSERARETRLPHVTAGPPARRPAGPSAGLRRSACRARHGVGGAAGRRGAQTAPGDGLLPSAAGDARWPRTCVAWGSPRNLQSDHIQWPCGGGGGRAGQGSPATRQMHTGLHRSRSTWSPHASSRPWLIL